MYYLLFAMVAILWICLGFIVLNAIYQRTVFTYVITATELQIRFLKILILKRIPLAQITDVRRMSLRDLKKILTIDLWANSWIRPAVLITYNRKGLSRLILLTPIDPQKFVDELVLRK